MNDTRVVPCSRSAHDRNVLARRAQLDHYECHSQRGKVNKLGGDGEEWPGALLARRAPTMKRWSLDARNEDHTSRLAEYG